MPKYRLRYSDGPETPNFTKVNDLRAWLIEHYGDRSGVIGIYKYDGKKYGWIRWATFRTTKEGWNWTGPNRTSQWLTKSGNAKR